MLDVGEVDGAIPQENLSPKEVATLSSPEFASFLSDITSGPVGEASRKAPAIVPYLPTVATRFVLDIPLLTTPEATEEEKATAVKIGLGTIGTLTMLSESSLAVSPELVEKFYNNIHSPNETVVDFAALSILPLTVLDHRNKERGQLSFDLNERLADDIAQKMIQPNAEIDGHTAGVLLDETTFNDPEITKRILKKAVTLIRTEQDALRLYATMADRTVGFEELRKLFREVATEDPLLREKYQIGERALGLAKDGERHHVDVGELYESVGDMTDYRPYQELQAIDTAFLKDALPKNGPILDIGAGSGRHLTELRSVGYDVVGIDPKPNLSVPEIQVGSWDKPPFEPESFAAVYSLGRSAMHITTPWEYIRILNNINGILQPNGIFLMDTPNQNNGQFAKTSQEFRQTANDIGIHHVETGSLHDSPNSLDFTDRFAPAPEQLKAFAWLAGFDAELIQTHMYTDQQGFTNENLYWRLTKGRKELTLSEIEEIIKTAFGGKSRVGDKADLYERLASNPR